MKPIREWTVLVYMADNNNLSKGAQSMLRNQLGELEPSDKVSIAVEYSHSRDAQWHHPSGVTHARAEVTADGLKTLEKRPYENMADPATLENFLEWGIQAYPAKNYMVIVQGHGGAWRASLPDEGTRVGEPLYAPEPYSGDGTRAATMSVPAFAEALRNVETQTGVKPAVLAFDSCLMSNTEAAYELKDRAQVLIGSEDIISSTPSEYALDYAVPLKPILQRLSERLDGHQAVDASTIALDWVEACKSSWTTPTQTAIDLRRMDAIAQAVDRLADALLDPAVDASVIREAANRARNFSEKEKPDAWDRKYDYKIFLRDLEDLAKSFGSDKRLAHAKKAAQGVIRALHEARVAHQSQSIIQVEGRTQYGDSPMFKKVEMYDAGRTNGLSIYLPDNADVVSNQEADGQDYDALAFVRETKWGNVVRKTVGAMGPQK